MATPACVSRQHGSVCHAMRIRSTLPLINVTRGHEARKCFAVEHATYAKDGHHTCSHETSAAAAVSLRPVNVVLTALSCLFWGCVSPSGACASLGDAAATTLRGALPDYAVVLILAALPLVELRGAIPVGIVVLGMHPVFVYSLAIVGNMLPVPVLLLTLGPLSKALSGIPAIKTIFDKIFDRARNQGAAWKENEFAALALFVGVPLPGTGAWSGAIGAFVLGMPFWTAVAANFVGVCIAGALVVTLSLMGWTGLYVAAAVLLGGPGLALLIRSLKSSR